MKFLKERIEYLFTKPIYHKIDELPLWNYDRCFSDVRYLYKLKSYDKLPRHNIKLKEVFEDIYYQIIDQVGEKGEVQLYRQKKMSYWKLYWKYVSSENRALLTKIKILEKELAKYQNVFEKRTKANLYEQISIIGRHRGGEFINPKQITVAQWINYLKEYEEFVRKENEAIRRKKTA